MIADHYISQSESDLEWPSGCSGFFYCDELFMTHNQILIFILFQKETNKNFQLVILYFNIKLYFLWIIFEKFHAWYSIKQKNPKETKEKFHIQK